MTKPLKSIHRVANAAKELGLEINVLEMEQSTRTAQEAADAVGCEVAQIVKSMVFERKDNQALVLVLVSGAHNADMKLLAGHFGTKLDRADPRKIREQTGFAIGGVSAIGHLIDIPVVMDETLLTLETVWVAAGKPNALFSVDAKHLAGAVKAVSIKIQ